MIPFFQFQTIALGPLTIYVWGLCVALGIALAFFLAQRFAMREKLASEAVFDVMLWATVGGLIGSRLAHVLFYAPQYYLAHPTEILAFWHGGSASVGGLVGGVIGIWLWAKTKKISRADVARYLDVAALGLWFGWAVGRVGCFLIHDHPGTLSHFVLAVRFPGGARHDLGLYEAMLTLTIGLVALLLYYRLPRRAPRFIADVTLLLFTVARFFLDFLRATDVVGADARYAHLTPAQWGMIVLGATLTIILFSGKLTAPKARL